MPTRKVRIINGEIYHVFNRTIDKRQIFIDPENNSHFIELIRYYRSIKAKISYSRTAELTTSLRANLFALIKDPLYFRQNILSYSLMPTHFHFLLQQKIEQGIERFIADITNAYVRYFNIKNEHMGPLFLPRFKAERITSEEQLIHVSRYIHLNPYSSGIVKNISGLKNYKWSSYREFVTPGVTERICKIDTVLSHFRMNREQYQKFVEANADHQKMLEMVKHTKKW